MNKRLNRTTLYIVAICVFLLAVNVSLGFVLTRQSSAAMRSLIEDRMLDVSNTAAALLDGDTLEALQAEDKDTPEYQNVLRMLTSFEENIELEYIYCVRDLGDGNFVFMIDPDPEAPGAFGDHIPYTDALHEASLGTPAVDKVPYQDDWGRFYSAYSPVFDSRRQVAGIVAVDFSAQWYENQISNQVRATLLISAISLFFAVVIIILITTRFRKRFHLMLNEMNVVSAGIETLVHEVSPGIEVSARRESGESDADDELSELGNRIRSLEDQLSEQIMLVRSQAYIDGLTGVGNRAAYEEHVKRLDDGIRAGKASFAVALFDMNGLKEINDRLGHEQGDQAIKKVASTLKQVFGGEQLYRIGGDEFIVIFEGEYDDMESRLEQVDGALEANGAVTVAKGRAAFSPDADEAYREVFARADGAMYEDKKAYYQAHAGMSRRHSDLSGGSVYKTALWKPSNTATLHTTSGGTCSENTGMPCL